MTLWDTAFRGIIQYQPEDNIPAMILNFEYLKGIIPQGYSSMDTDEKDLFNWISGFYEENKDTPQYSYCLERFNYFGAESKVQRIQDFASCNVYYGGTFRRHIKDVLETKGSVQLKKLLQAASDILGGGIEQDGEILQGLNAAVKHLIVESPKFIIKEVHSDDSGDLRDEGQQFREEITNAYQNPESTMGVMCGIAGIDESTKGIKKGQLWIHAAPPGSGKTTFGVNFAYNASVLFRKNVVLAELEMNRKDIRRQFYTIHANHEQFAEFGAGRIEYGSLRDGSISEQQLKVMNEVIITDMEENPHYGNIELFAPSEAIDTARLWNHLEALQKDQDIDLCVIDYVEWLKPNNEKAHKDYTQRINAIVQEVKQMAQYFNRGKGLGVVLLVQINRSGIDKAAKDGGKFGLTSFSYSNQIEKTADIITTSYWDEEMRDRNVMLFGNSKNRDNKPFEPFELSADLGIRKIWNLQDQLSGQDLKDVYDPTEEALKLGVL